MKPAVLMPLAFMCCTTALIISSVVCGTTTVQCRRSGASGGMGVSATSGVLPSAATCAIAAADGTPFEPIIASTLSSETNLRAFFAALSGLDSSSRMM